MCAAEYLKLRLPQVIVQYLGNCNRCALRVSWNLSARFTNMLLYSGHILHRIRIISIPIDRRRCTYINGREALERKPLYDSLKTLLTKRSALNCTFSILIMSSWLQLCHTKGQELKWLRIKVLNNKV